MIWWTYTLNGMLALGMLFNLPLIWKDIQWLAGKRDEPRKVFGGVVLRELDLPDDDVIDCPPTGSKEWVEWLDSKPRDK